MWSLTGRFEPGSLSLSLSRIQPYRSRVSGESCLSKTCSGSGGEREGGRSEHVVRQLCDDAEKKNASSFDGSSYCLFMSGKDVLYSIKKYSYVCKSNRNCSPWYRYHFYSYVALGAIPRINFKLTMLWYPLFYLNET